MAAYFLGIDVGTSGTKTILVDLKGRVVASATADYPLLMPKPGWTEQNPGDWWNAAKKTIAAVVKSAKVRPSDIRAVGLSGQMHGSVFLDKNRKVVRPCLLWNDSRTAEVCQEITQRLGEKMLHQSVANPVLTGFTLPKVVWLQEKEPARFRRVRHIMLPKDYVRMRLTGEIFTEVSDAAGSLMYDVHGSHWSTAILEALSIPVEWLPQVRQSHEPCGSITKEVAGETGLLAGTPVVGGAADQPAGAVGTGVVRQGQVMCSIGTSGVIFAATDHPDVDAKERLHTFNHAVPHCWYLMGCVLSAGGSLAWYRNQFAEAARRQAKKEKVDVYDILLGQAARIPIGSEGLFFLPYLTGERSPHKDPYARGAFVGLSVRTTREHMVRAIVEGVTFALRDCIEVIREQGIKLSEIRATGGGARSKVWRQMLADVFQTEIALLSSEEGPALGGAILAAVGAGEFANTREACDHMIKIRSRVSPNRKNFDRYEEAYRHFTTLYPILKRSFRGCVDLGA